MMVEILQTFGRVVLAALSGAMLIFGTIFFADRWSGEGMDAFLIVDAMLGDEQYKYIFLSSTGVTAYVIGIVNVAASSLVFGRVVRKRKDDLLIISQIESLKKPQLLKETLDLLNLKRTLVAFFFPLFYFGAMLAIDTKQWGAAHVSIPVGIVLALGGPLSFYLAACIGRQLESTIETVSPSVLPPPDVPPRLGSTN